jgi:SAM-dependent methyltransferase
MSAADIPTSDADSCVLCGGRDIRDYHDQGYRKVVKCRDCGMVSVRPIPDPGAKYETERLAYVGEILPETAEFFRDCNRNFEETAVIGEFRRALDWIETRCERGTMLDVGPGTGIFLHLARERGWQPFGIDLCELSAERAIEEFDIKVDVGNFTDFPYEANSFDCITMLDVVEHSRDPVAFLRRAHEVLKPGGTLYVAVPNQRSLLTVILDRWIRLGLPFRSLFLERLYVSPHLYYFNPSVLQRILEQTGFEVQGVRGGNVYLGRYRLPIWMRIPLEIVLRAGSMVGMSARLTALAHKPAADSSVDGN